MPHAGHDEGRGAFWEKRRQYFREGVSALSKAIDDRLPDGGWLQSTTDSLALKASPEYREVLHCLVALCEKYDAPRL